MSELELPEQQSQTQSHLSQFYSENDASEITETIKRTNIISLVDTSKVTNVNDTSFNNVPEVNTNLVLIKKYKRKSKQNYCCSLCKKNFHYKKNYEKHIVTCDYQEQQDIKLSTSSSTKQPNETKQPKKVEKTKNKTYRTNERPDYNIDAYDAIPSQQQLFDMLQTLIVKYDKLECEFNQMKTYINNKKKRIRVIDYLNDPSNINKSTNILSFLDWIETFTIDREDLLYMFEYKFISGIMRGIIKFLPIDKADNHSIKCFDQNKNIYYKFTVGREEPTTHMVNTNLVSSDFPTETQSQNQLTTNQIYKWEIMDEEDFNLFIMKIKQAFMREFQKWRNENKHEIDHDDQMYDIYMENMKTVLGGNHEQEYNLKQIKNKLYEYLKCNLKSMVQLEFTF